MEQDRELVMRQYELMVNSSIQVTNWRQSANGYFLAVNTALLAIATYLTTLSPQTGLIIGIIGIAISLLWFEMIKYFKSLNAAKFSVLHEIEVQLPIQLFHLEDTYFKKESRRIATQIEGGIPLLFGVIYLVIISLSLYGLLSLILV